MVILWVLLSNQNPTLLKPVSCLASSMAMAAPIITWCSERWQTYSIWSVQAVDLCWNWDLPGRQI